MPDLVAPMLASPGPVPVGSGWAFEYKFDGVRAISYISRGGVRVLSRNNNDITGTYPELRELGGLLAGRQAIVDGEIVALEHGQRPSFARLQTRMHVAAPTAALLRGVPVVYYVFDVLHLDDTPTIDLPYLQRRDLLTELALTGETVQTPGHFVHVDGHAVLRAAELGGMEGVIGKRLDSTYRPGRRSTDWTKSPLVRTQEVVILGYTAGSGRRAGTIGSLLLGVYDQSGVLAYAGHVGTGFTATALRALHAQLRPLHRPEPPTPDVPREHARHAQWVDPVLTGEVAFRTWTPDGRLRHASWRGLRPDREPRSATRLSADELVGGSAPVEVEGAMRTGDGQWRVEAVRRGPDRWYRIVRDDNVLDWLSLADVERILTEAQIDMRLLREADPAA
ncbi:non-homologous end-joining DNA ligase [Plantactinospora sp. CA-290183]|uniref:non-homologous end-joining DNA ligase n=1 Tax=Plantactinospora sp. CA-290183 TaxID=3240006 RepID=UPI003D8E19A3